MEPLELASGHIRVRTANQVLRVTLDRADKRNALTHAMYHDLNRCARHAADTDDIRALLIDAEGEMFCAGNDIGDFVEAKPRTGSEITSGPALTFVKTLRALDKPIVVAVQGQATGIGTTLLLHADLVVAANSARFYTAFIDLALVPEAGSSLLLPALVGRQNAARLLLAGDTLDAAEAERMGLVAYRVADAELADYATALAARLAAKPPTAMQLTKQLLRQGEAGRHVEEQIDREGQIFAKRLISHEVRAILDRFLKRRR